MSQARLPRTEPSTELITAHKVNTATLMPPVQTRDFSALPKHRDLEKRVRERETRVEIYISRAQNHTRTDHATHTHSLTHTFRLSHTTSELTECE